jgi:two-component system CheB/CheR fusion protein
VTVDVDRSDTELSLTVTDNGKGFAPGRSGSGMGLKIMAYRASMIGGKLTVQSAAGRGTKVICTAPI